MTEHPPQAIFYDFDGVLAESVEVKTRAFYRLYEKHGAQVAEKLVAYHLANGGVSRYRKFDYAQQTLLGRPALTEQERGMLDQEFSRLVVEGVVHSDWVPGARDMLEYYLNVSRQFVVSGTPREELRRIVTARGMAHYFDEVFGSPATKTELTALLLDRYALTPDRCLFIGDALADYEAATALGIPFVGRVTPGEDSPFPGDTRTVPDLDTLVPVQQANQS